MCSALAAGARRKAAPYRLTEFVPREGALQKQITDTMRIEVAREGHVSRHGVVWFSIDMASYAGTAPGTRVARGCIAGCPDMIVLWRGAAHWIEIKADDGEMSEEQQAVCAALLRAHCRYGVARNAAEVMACLDRWAVPRALRVHL